MWVWEYLWFDVVVVVFLVVQTLQQDNPQQPVGLMYQLPVV